MLLEQPTCDPARAVELHRDENAQIVVHSNPASVEDLVMKRAEREAIGHSVWPAVLFPADVGSLERDILSAEPKIKTADRTAMLVGSDHVAAKPWVTSPSGAAGGVSKRNLDRRQDVVVHGLREVSLEQRGGYIAEERRVPLQGLVDLRREPARDVMLDELALENVCIAGSALQAVLLRDQPETVVLETPERVLRVKGLPRGPELLQESAQGGIDLAVRDEPIATAQQPT